jgi:hypothetical protein
MPTSETLEKNAIKQYLKLKQVFFYYNLAGIGAYKGIPDITAIDKNGQVYQIEAKAKGGLQSNFQKEFQKNWEEFKGIYILGDLEEVMKFIK